MKALVFKRYGSPDVLTFEDIPQPEPGDGQVLIKVQACALNYADWRLLTGDPFFARLAFGFPNPKIHTPGADVAGQIVATGKNVTRFKAGDEVFGDLEISGCGGLAEYVLADEPLLALKPAGISFEQTAALPMAAVTALQALRQGGIQAGQKVLINGASGGVAALPCRLPKLWDVK